MNIGKFRVVVMITTRRMTKGRLVPPPPYFFPGEEEKTLISPFFRRFYCITLSPCHFPPLVFTPKVHKKARRRFRLLLCCIEEK